MVAVPADIPDDVARTALALDVPDTDWRRYPPLAGLRETGRRWLTSMATAVLHVPSAIIPSERNYLLNPAHPDFRQIQVGSPRPFSLRIIGARG